ncbi:substrate-binding domain-containing protein [Paenibacillus sp. FA6]|uniref:substrate-binding domain-containing protein n=1 Tax=Paenibacillus sp. FA6 TaxID=3413029 RepID=UPI003F65AEBC
MLKQRWTLWLVLAMIVIGIYSVFYFKLLSDATREGRSVTVILKSLNIRHDFWQAVDKGAEAAAKEMGINLNIEGPLSEGDSDTQFRILEAAIERKPEAIVIAPIIDDRMRKALARASAEGIKVVIINMSPDMKPSPVVVTSDHVEAGRLAAQTSIEEASGQPVIAIISNHANSIVSAERLMGIQRALVGYEESLRGVYYADSSEDRAYEIVKQLLLSEVPFNTFIALNESASQGVARVLKEQNRVDDINLIGFDSTSDEVPLLESRIMKASIVQKPFNMGYLGVKTALKLMDGDPTDPIIYIESNVIAKGNMYTTENQKLLFPFINSK